MKQTVRLWIMIGFAALAWPVILVAQTSVPLKANFVNNPGFQLLNDKELGEYSYADSGGRNPNPFIGFESKTGQFTMSMTSNKRYVRIYLNDQRDPAPVYDPRSACYPNLPPNTAAIKSNFFRTMSEFLDTNGDGKLEQTGQALNVKDMVPGEVKFCFLTIRFEVTGDSSFFELGGGEVSAIVQVSVEQQAGGHPVWIFKPLSGYQNRTLWRIQRRTCDLGDYFIDFELRVAKII